MRLLRRSPVYSLTVIGLLGLGIGASTVIFTAVDAFLLRPLPVAAPERLARFGVEMSATHVSFIETAVYARVLAARGRSFDAVFTYYPLDAAFVSGRHVETLTCHVVSDNYFTALGLRPERGSFSGGAVLSHELWRRTGGAISSGIRVRGAAFTVTGVMPPDFGGLDLERRADVWVPDRAWTAWTGQPAANWPAQILLRVRDGVGLAQAQAEAAVLYPAMVDADLAGVPGITAADIARAKERRVVVASAARGVSAMRKQFSTAMPVLLGAIVALLLLIAANVGGLMLARCEVRRAEFALRRSLGASGWSMARAALAESLALAAAGALLGWLIAQYSAPLLAVFLPSNRPLNVSLRPDARVLAFTIAVTAGVALLAGIAPALSAVRTDLMQVLGRGGSRLASPVFGRSIVAVQVALAILLVAASLSLVQSLHALRTADPGFDRERLVVALLDPRMAGVKGAQVPPLYEEILRRARELPGAAGASLAGAPLMRGVGLKNTLAPAGAWLTPADRLNVSLNFATETHFENLGMKLIAGRGLRASDLGVRPAPVVVTESLAKQFFSGMDPLGREFGRAGPGGTAGRDYRVVGVVRDVKYRGMREIAPPTFFAAFSGDEEFVTLHVRTRLHDSEMIRQVRAMLAAIGPGLAPVTIATMEQEIGNSLWQERMLSFLSEVFAVLAALIAGIGLFGLLGFTLARRTREVGIRVAIGATPRRILALFARFTAMAAGPGILVGAAAFAVVRRALHPLLFGSGTGAAAPLLASVSVLTLLTVAAVAVPVFRATRVQPTVALRQE